MLKVTIKNAAAFDAHLAALIEGIPLIVSKRFYFWTVKIFQDLVLSTPQWSGDLASNWKYSVGSPDGSYTPIGNKSVMWPWHAEVEPHEAGDWQAWEAAKVQFDSVEPPRYDQKVYFTNNTPIAPDVESRSIYIRPVNLVSGKVAMASFIAAKWKMMPV